MLKFQPCQKKFPWICPSEEMIDRLDLMITQSNFGFLDLRYNTIKSKNIILNRSKDTLRMNGYLDNDVVLSLCISKINGQIS